jgi:Ca-activated chloride channel family protein
MLNNFNFANSLWLFGLLAVPIVWALYFLLHHVSNSSKNLEEFADKHLLPHLLKNKNIAEQHILKPLLLWSLVWICGTLAMAGPRWDYTEMDTFTSAQSMVILLDLSQSMDAADVKPSRIARARQEIEDIVNMNNGIKIGLVAFAAEAHMISPITDDMETIRNLLPSLDTSLVTVQGSRLTPALEMAENLLKSESANHKYILIVSDGGFEDNSAISAVHKLAGENIIIDTMGVGTSTGAPIPDTMGNVIKEHGTTVISHLETDQLEAVSKSGNGFYVEANYLDSDSKSILNQVTKTTEGQDKSSQKTRYWEERFYMLVIVILLPVLLWFRRGYVFPAVLLMLLLPHLNADAAELSSYFKNNQQQGKEAFDKGDFPTAAQKFDDAYMRGVAEYKAEKFEEAEKSFAESKRKDVALNAKYNLGNAQIKQQKTKEAIASYEDVLKADPDNKNAKFNLELAKKIIEQKKQQNQASKDDKNQKNEDKKDSDKEGEGSHNEQPKDDGKDKKDGKDGDKKDEQKDKQSDDGKPKDAQTDKDKKDENGKQNPDKKDDTKNPQSADADNNGNRQKDGQKAPKRTARDVDADQWLSRIQNNPKAFLKNQFSIESQRKGTKEAVQPW